MTNARTALGLCLYALTLGAVPAQAETTDPAITVTGRPDPEGLLPLQTAPQAVSAIATDFITKQAPTFNAFQLVDLLPGANVSSSDPYGLSVTSSLTLRGLGQDEIGVLMEGAPQNDIGYYYAYPSQFADAENVRQVALTQGAADIAAPVVGNAGGLLSLSLDDPHVRMGALTDASLGSYAERRVFARVDTGVFGPGNLRAFVSFSDNRADNWRGAGFDTRQHLDAKVLGEWGDGNRASLAVSFNNADTSTYPGPTLTQWQQVGRAFNYDATYTDGDTNYWRLYRSPFRNLYFSAPLHLNLGQGLKLDSTAYLQFGYGNSPYGTQLATTGNYQGTELLAQPITLPGAENGVATVLGNYTGQQFRAGDVVSLTIKTGVHTLTAGLWFDTGSDHDVQSYGAIQANGTPVDPWGHESQAIRTADGRVLAYEDERTITATRAGFVGDSVALSPRVTLDLAFKGVDVLHNGVNFLPGPQSGVRLDSFAALPRAALHWQIDDRQQVFANLTTSFRAPDEYTLYNTYYDGVISTQGTTALKNEYAVGEELGYRLVAPNLSFSVTAFHLHFANRQLATVINSGGALVNSTLNAGAQTSYGVDGEVDWRPAKGVSLYLSGEALHARIDDDVPVAGDLLPTRGRHAVSSPAVQIGFGTTYDDGHLFASSALKYVARQYSTFTNDESIPGYATLDLGLGVHLAGLIDAKRTDLRLNVINAANPHVLSGVQMVSTNAQDTLGRNGTLIAGTAPAYYIGAGRAFVVTLVRAW
jgi:iron complex outermembrane receptor protein